jgi:hypothetical protein
MTRGLRGFLMSAVRDLTVLIAACLAFLPTLMATSESEDRDLSDGVDGDRPRLWLAMIDESNEIFCLHLMFI